MYTVTVIESFSAEHFLTVPDPGPEGEVHAHDYAVELTLSGPALDEFDYLVDIDEVEDFLAGIRSRYADSLLNDQDRFEGHNPSVERFARVIWGAAVDDLDTEPLDTIDVTVWEDETARAAYEAVV